MTTQTITSANKLQAFFASARGNIPLTPQGWIVTTTLARQTAS